MIRVQVTQDDIKNGEPGACGYCPIALALERTLLEYIPSPLLVTVQMHSANIRLILPNFETESLGTMYLPLICNTFINRFDRGNQVEPFEFNIRPFSPLDQSWPSIRDRDAAGIAMFYYKRES